MHNFTANYEKILEVLSKFSSENILPYQRRVPKLKDIEVIDSENHLFRLLPDFLRLKIERSVYNRRKRRLFPYLEKLRQCLSECFIVDSMPLEICKLSRSARSKICKESALSCPNKGYCAAQSKHYYGYKLHAVCSFRGVIKSLDITPASVHDIHYLKDIKSQIENCTLLGDRGYLSSQHQLNLFESCQIKLEVPMRRNQHNYKPQPYIFRKSRKRIETLFSQLCDQFMIQRNYAKSFEGYKTRILSKITAATVVQYINKFIFDRNINNIKISII